MKPPAFSYHDPRSVADAVALLASLDNAKLLAGGQSLMPMLNMRYVLPDHVIDLNRVDGLSYIRETDGALEIGAMTRQRDIEFSDLVRRRCPLMHEAIAQVGHRQTRNRGTLGGSLCHLDPAAELVAVAAALDAKVTIAGKAGTRAIDFAAFPVAYMTPALEPDELLDRREFSLLVGAARFCLRRIFPPPRRFRHRLRGGAARGRRRRQSHPRVADARRHGPGAAARHRRRARADRRDNRRQAAARTLRAAAQARCNRRHPRAGVLSPATGDGAVAPRARQGARAHRGEGGIVSEQRTIAVTVNGKRHEATVPVRLTLADFLRQKLRLTGTHLGCEHGVCGACTILFDGHSARSCLMLAVQADGHDILTVEGIAPDGKTLHPLQQAFHELHGLQCGFCTPGILTTLIELLRDNPNPTEDDIRIGISGNLCRCTGYHNIVAAALDAARRLRGP